MTRTIGLAATVLLLGVAAGCGQAESSGQEETPPPVERAISLSWANAYPTAEEMAANADAVVLGVVGPPVGVEVVEEITYTDHNYEVSEWLLGDPNTDDSIVIHQTGGTYAGITSIVEDDPLLVPGEVSLMFLKRVGDSDMYFVMGGPTGRLILADDGTLNPLPSGQPLENVPASTDDVITDVREGARR